uniref:Glycosyltransferase 2-like domain-containing protein n=1 Tax=Hucho hucho TaxID=62062 RepID=A0A4W5Q9S4_9TELE
MPSTQVICRSPVSRLEGVRLVRRTRRLGVAGRRTLGAARAVGEALVFMDSHCGCHSGWLEPLLERVAQDRCSCVGDSIEVVPCSRVAHLGRHHLSYPLPDQDILQRNNIRIADTWLGDLLSERSLHQTVCKS